MLKKSTSDKINITENAIFFLLQAPTHQSFTFNLRFLYELKDNVCLSKTVGGISHFQFHFTKVYIFVQQNAWTMWFWNAMFSIKIKIIKTSHAVLLPDLWFLSYNKKF